MKSGCELCRKMARMRCEADQARLCRDCDAEVHSANFLVARHSRNLLCRVCQSPTPWSASGAFLPPAISICWECAAERSFGEQEVEEILVVPWSPPPESCSSTIVAITMKRARIVDAHPSRTTDGGYESLSSDPTTGTVRRVGDRKASKRKRPSLRASASKIIPNTATEETTESGFYTTTVDLQLSDSC